MAFKMRAEVDDWFRNIFKKGPIQTKFDLYYFCLMAGLAEGKTEPAVNATEFVDSFVRDYQPNRRLILGLMILAEAARLGLNTSDRAEVEKLMKKYLDAAHPAQLTELGFECLNDYAQAGFIAISEALQGNKPHQVETFLHWFSRYLVKRIAENPFWKNVGAVGAPPASE